MPSELRHAISKVLLEGGLTLRVSTIQTRSSQALVQPTRRACLVDGLTPKVTITPTRSWQTPVQLTRRTCLKDGLTRTVNIMLTPSKKMLTASHNTALADGGTSKVTTILMSLQIM